jgi:hypothetical protein
MATPLPGGMCTLTVLAALLISLTQAHPIMGHLKHEWSSRDPQLIHAASCHLCRVATTCVSRQVWCRGWTDSRCADTCRRLGNGHKTLSWAIGSEGGACLSLGRLGCAQVCYLGGACSKWATNTGEGAGDAVVNAALPGMHKECDASLRRC